MILCDREVRNTGTLTLVLEPGIRICQPIFEVVDGTPEIGYGGQFNAEGREVLRVSLQRHLLEQVSGSPLVR